MSPRGKICKVLLLGMVAIAMVIPGSDVAMSQAPLYTAIDLHPSGFTTSQGLGISDGQQVGTGRTTGGQIHALLWRGNAGSVVDLHPSGFILSEARSTSGGQQVGDGVPAGGGTHALLWNGSAGSVVDLHPSGFTTSVATGTFGRQQVGWQQVGYGSPATGGGGHALLWSGSAGSAVDLNPSGFDDSIAYGISGGQQVGAGRPIGVQPEHARLWSGSPNSVVDLNPSGFEASTAFGISGGQQVGYGGGPTTAGVGHALLWSGSAGSAVDLHPSTFIGSQALGTNGTQQVGFGVTGGHNHALVWSGSASKVVDLHQFLPQGFTDSQANGIDSTGNIVGWAFDGSNYHAFLWSTSTFWGVDSLERANFKVGNQFLFDVVTSIAGRAPAFWGRYIGKTGNLTPGEVTFLHGRNCRILLIFRDTARDRPKPNIVRTEKQGIDHANDAIAAARTLGAPGGKQVWIYADLEVQQTPTAAWFKGWFDTMQSSPYGGGVYGNTDPRNASHFNTPYCTAYNNFSAGEQRAAYVYANQRNIPCNTSAAAAPPFNPLTPPCNPPVVIYQYSTDCLFNGQEVDLDVANAAGFASMWM